MVTEKKRDVDDLVAESRRIRDEFLRMVARLDVFASQLAEEAAKLHEATGDGDDE